MVLSPLFLVFMLGLGLTPLTSAKDGHTYRHFLTQHYDPSPKDWNNKYCETMMMRRHLTKPCKGINTFVHSNKKDIKDICKDKNGKPYRGNLRISKSLFQVTICKHNGGSTRAPCHYQATKAYRLIAVGCAKGWPIHFDESFVPPSK